MTTKGIFNPAIYPKKRGEDVAQGTPIISVGEDGKVTATVTQEAGYVEKGVKISEKQLPTREGSVVTPTREEQTLAERGEFMKGAAKVAPIPEEYIIPSGSEEYTDNGAYDVRHLAKVTVNVKKDSEEPTPIVEQATPVISVSDSGLITAEATQAAGKVAAGKKSSTYQMPTESGKTVIPSTEAQTVARAGTFVTGDIIVAAVEESGGGSGNTSPADLIEIAEELGDLAPTITIGFVYLDWDSYETIPTTKSGEYRIGNDGEWVSFNDVSSLILGFVPIGTAVNLRYCEVDTSTDEVGCTFEHGWDGESETYYTRVIPNAENASVKLYYYG